jgi:hypothetical protein
MLKAFLMLLLIFVSGSAMAEWVEIGTSNDGDVTVYAKPSSILKHGSTVEIWWLSDLRNAQKMGKGTPYLSTKLHYAFDCKGEQSRTLALYSYAENMGRGEAIHSEDFEFQGWSAIPPDSVYEIVWKFACGKRQ